MKNDKFHGFYMINITLDARLQVVTMILKDKISSQQIESKHLTVTSRA